MTHDQKKKVTVNKDNIMKPFNLKKEREKLGLTQEDVADGTGYALRSVNRHENEGFTNNRQLSIYKDYFEKMKNKC